MKRPRLRKWAKWTCTLAAGAAAALAAVQQVLHPGVRDHVGGRADDLGRRRWGGAALDEEAALRVHPARRDGRRTELVCEVPSTDGGSRQSLGAEGARGSPLGAGPIRVLSWRQPAIPRRPHADPRRSPLVRRPSPLRAGFVCQVRLRPHWPRSRRALS